MDIKSTIKLIRKHAEEQLIYEILDGIKKSVRFQVSQYSDKDIETYLERNCNFNNFSIINVGK